jgi:hypothetical protein
VFEPVARLIEVTRWCATAAAASVEASEIIDMLRRHAAAERKGP